jgi:multidrug efflux system membrane fusion protein
MKRILRSAIHQGLILGTGIAFASCSSKAPKQELAPPAVPVQTASVEVRDVPLFFEAMGVVKSARSADVKPQVTGMIKEVHFNEGQWIDEGVLLYTLEDAPYTIRVQEAEAQAEQNRAHLGNATKKLERYKSLSKQDLIAEVEWDELETKVSLHQAMLKADEARLATARLDLEHCKIRAPISGLAGKSALHAGNIASFESLVTLTTTDPLFVDFSITEKELLQITIAAPSIKVYAAGNQECLGLGKVTFMDHAIDSKTGMLAATAKLAKGHKPLWPGQSLRVHLYFGKKENALLIPIRAVRTNQDGPYIFRVKEDNTVEICSIKLGPEEKGQIVVEEGLDGSSKVVIEGQLRLSPGSKIEDVRS